MNNISPQKINTQKMGKMFKQSKLISNVLLAALIILPVIYSCSSSRRLMTEDLFMQYRRVSISHLSEMGDEQGRVLQEQVKHNYEDRELNDSTSNVKYSEKAKLDTSKTYTLRDLRVTSKARFTPIRDGRVTVDFLVNIPKEVLSENWQITLEPILFHNDSIVHLKDLIIKGRAFADKQAGDHRAYGDFANSIIHPKDYDEMFLDHNLIQEGMKARQKLFLELYTAQWNDIKSYNRWKNMMTQRYDMFNTLTEGKKMEVYNRLRRESNFEARYLGAVGQDTTGVWKDRQKKYNRKERKYNRFQREITLRTVPGEKFKQIYRDGTTFEDIQGNAASERDSMEIARHSYMYGSIAENEYRTEHQDEFYKLLVPFPYRTDMRMDTIIDAGADMLYIYTQDYPVTAGLENVKITMNGFVNAVDRSGYTLPPLDTLTFVISSLDQLVDTSLITKKTMMYRNMHAQLTLHPKFDRNKATFNPNREDNRDQIDSVVRYFEFIANRGLEVDSVIMRGMTSLAGGYNLNASVAEERSIAIKEYLKQNHSQIDIEGVFLIRPQGEDWNGLVRQLRANKDIENKQEILDMISMVTHPDDFETELQELYPQDFKIISEQIYPNLERLDLTYYMSRPGMHATDSVDIEFRSDYAEGVRLLQAREYWEALQLLYNYPDYNAALTLLCMGQDQPAYDLLIQLEQTGGVHYLLAIAGYRVGYKAEAAEHLVEACRLDPSKIYRAPLDYETQQLIREFDLMPRLRVAELEGIDMEMNGGAAQTEDYEAVNNEGDEQSGEQEAESGSLEQDAESGSLEQDAESDSLEQVE